MNTSYTNHYFPFAVLVSRILRSLNGRIWSILFNFLRFSAAEPYFACGRHHEILGTEFDEELVFSAVFYWTICAAMYNWNPVS